MTFPGPGKMQKRTAHPYSLLLLAIVLGVHGILSFLLFDPSIALVEDDANYILGAKRFLEDGVFPLAHGATLYHLVLTIPYAVFGPSVLIGKYCSLLWSTLTLVITFFTFRKLVSIWVLFGVLLIQASNFRIHYYGSSNMSESFFMMVQMIFIWVVIRYHSGLLQPVHRNKDSILKFLANAIPVLLISFLVSISKSIGIVAPLSIFVYLILKKKWINGTVFLLLFFALKSTYEVGVKAFYGIEQLSTRSGSILLKSHYHPDQGNESILGLVVRLWQNFNHHISGDMLRILGWRENFRFIEPVSAFSILFLLVFAVVLWWNWRRRSRLLFVGVYLSLLASGTFIALQAHWKQDRMILIMIPLILLFLFDGAHKFLRKRWAISVPILYGYLSILCIVNLNHLGAAITRNRAIFHEYVKGNIHYAYTPDWRNYLKAAQWAEEHLPQDSVVLCRKANTATVFASGNIEFQGRSRQVKTKGDIALRELQESGVTHILLANLRIIPDQAMPGMVMGTIHSYVIAIQQYDRDALRPLYSTGGEEPAHILEIDYSSL